MMVNVSTGTGACPGTRMGWCGVSGWKLLVIFSALSVMLSLAILATGTIFKFSPHLVLRFLTNNDVTPTMTSKDLPIISEVGVSILVMGGVICVIGFASCGGACFKCRCLLLTVGLLNIMMAAGVSVLTGFLFTRDSVLHAYVRGYLTEVTSYEARYNPGGAYIHMLNTLSTQMKCCGINGPSDLDTEWSRETTLVSSVCCKTTTMCQKSDNIYMKGCYDVIQGRIEDNNITIISTITAFVFIVMVQAAVALCILLDTTDNKVKPR